MVGLFKGNVNRPWWSIHHPSILKGLNLLQTQSCHCAPHLVYLVSQVLNNIPSFGDLVPAVTSTLSLGRKKWHRLEVKSSEKHWGKDCWAESFLNLPGSLFISALTWIMQGQTVVDISLIDRTPDAIICYWGDLWICFHFLFFSLWIAVIRSVNLKKNIEMKKK